MFEASRARIKGKHDNKRSGRVGTDPEDFRFRYVVLCLLIIFLYGLLLRISLSVTEFKQFYKNQFKCIDAKVMPTNKNDCDAISVLLGLAVFALPLTFLIPGFSIWDVVPKIRISRFHIIDQCVTWTQLNATLVTLMVIFFCLYLEMRKLMLDEMVEDVVTVTQATDALIQDERKKQAAQARANVKLLDASIEHYETLIMLKDDLRKREKQNIQHPPVIEPSTSEM